MKEKAVPLREPLFCIIFSHARCSQVCEQHQILNAGSCYKLIGKIVLPSEQESEPVLCGDADGVEDDDGLDNICKSPPVGEGFWNRIMISGD